jgi:hypothetical protein
MRKLMILIMGFFILLAVPTSANTDVCGVNDLISYSIDLEEGITYTPVTVDNSSYSCLGLLWGLSGERVNIDAYVLVARENIKPNAYTGIAVAETAHYFKYFHFGEINELRMSGDAHDI